MQQYTGNHNNVEWQGYDVENNAVYQSFMVTEVKERLADDSGQLEIESHLRGLASTSFETDNIDELLNAVNTEDKAWAVGEAFAEAILEKENNVEFPWNQKRDLRNENSSLSGADLIGLIDDNGQIKLLIGEVKTSYEDNHPPSVMSGSEGMIEQLKTYHTNRQRQMTIISWLFHRCKGTVFEEKLYEAIKFFISNGHNGLYIAGVLIRASVATDEMDLKNRGRALGNTIINGLTKGHLQAFYLPTSLDDFVNLATGGNQ